MCTCVYVCVCVFLTLNANTYLKKYIYIETLNRKIIPYVFVFFKKKFLYFIKENWYTRVVIINRFGLWFIHVRRCLAYACAQINQNATDYSMKRANSIIW